MGSRRVGSWLVMMAVGVPTLSAAEPSGAERLAEAVRASYRAGDPVAAARLLASDPRGATARDDRVRVTARFVNRAEGLELRVERRRGVAGALVVSVEPGTVGRPSQADDDDCWPQDLLLLRAPVISLAPERDAATVRVPVACASFRRQGPRGGEGYRLEGSRPDAPIARLAAALCAGEAPPHAQDPELALAIWIAHEGLTWQRFSGSSFRTFRTPRQWVEPRHARGAGRLLQRAGLHPARLPFFRAAPAEARPTPIEPPAPERPEPAPQTTS